MVKLCPLINKLCVENDCQFWKVKPSLTWKYYAFLRTCLTNEYLAAINNESYSEPLFEGEMMEKSGYCSLSR